MSATVAELTSIVHKGLIESFIVRLPRQSPSVKGYFRCLDRFRVLAKTSDVASQRDAIRAALISMPVEICRMIPQADMQAIDDLLSAELSLRAVVDADTLPEVVPESNMCVWQGDMSLLRCDAVVNPGNNALLGCFLPPHKCLDNILHAQSGPRLRIACADLLQQLGLEEDANGNCRVTPGFMLPAKHVFHTVGPCLLDETDRRRPPREPTPTDVAELTSCYISCLEAAHELGLRSVAFCCISTGIFGYPQEAACIVALETCREWIKEKGNRDLRIIFNVFKDEDLDVYLRTAPEVLAR